MKATRMISLFLFICGFWVLSGALNAKSDVDYEKLIDAQVKEYEAKLKKMKNPQAREMTQKIIENMKNGRLTVTRYDPDDSWNLIEVQVLPEGGSVTRYKENEVNVRDPWTYEMRSTYSASPKGYVREFEKNYQVNDPVTRKPA